ncbi:MAG: A/G-specific adenine glycosylase [Verrucomicrobiota bacterium]
MRDLTQQMDLKGERKKFQQALGKWYADAQRPLPWRTEPSLYRTVVSELMAQQTQIKTMLPYFERWMERFPDFDALAEAPPDDVLKHWEGLGYYSRARNLHKLAKEYVAADPKPTTRHEWMAMPGIGPYTSAAIASINFGESVAVVDGNVVRILARLTNDTRTFKSNGDAVKGFSLLAEEIVSSANPGDHNQAMMELGATICLKRKPLCTICPVQSFCAGYAREDIEELPRIARKATEQIEVQRAWVLRDDSILLQRIAQDAGQLAGQYELPVLNLIAAKPPEKPIITKTRSITHRRIREHIYAIKPSSAHRRNLSENPSLHWVDLGKLEAITLSGPHRRWVKELIRQAG